MSAFRIDYKDGQPMSRELATPVPWDWDAALRVTSSWRYQPNYRLEILEESGLIVWWIEDEDPSYVTIVAVEVS